MKKNDKQDGRNEAEEDDDEFYLYQYDDNLWKSTNPTDENEMLKLKEKVLLGTLVVRVVSCLDLSIEGVYALVRFQDGQVQKTCTVWQKDPIWPQSDLLYLDVFHDPTMMAHQDECFDQFSSLFLLTVALFHPVNDKKDIFKVQKENNKAMASGDSNDLFLGMASLNVMSLFTGLDDHMDEWLRLEGMEETSSSSLLSFNRKQKQAPRVRIICDYETLQPRPQPGNDVRFWIPDIFPLDPAAIYTVEEVDGNDVILSFTSSEGWLNTVLVHRHVILVLPRDQQEQNQDCSSENNNSKGLLSSIPRRLGDSPMVHTVKDQMDKFPQEGLVGLGLNAFHGGTRLLHRWWGGGIRRAVDDVVYATNVDGNSSNNNAQEDQDNQRPPVHDEMDESTSSSAEQQAFGKKELEEERQEPASLPVSSSVPSSPSSLMPPCPITGEPMNDPVVAADGHTYERSAIETWLGMSNKSPLTGSMLAHKQLVPNYMLKSLKNNSAPNLKDDRHYEEEAM